MARPKLPPNERLSTPVYVLLRAGDVMLLDLTAKRQGKSRGAVLRETFLTRYGNKPVAKQPPQARRARR